MWLPLKIEDDPERAEGQLDLQSSCGWNKRMLALSTSVWTVLNG